MVSSPELVAAISTGYANPDSYPVDHPFSAT
jgi:hypothetical protein